MSVTLELGRQSGVYDRVYDVTTLSGEIDSPVSLKLSELQAATRYYCRFKATAGGATVTSRELTFQTVTGLTVISVAPPSVSGIMESQVYVQTIIESDVPLESATIVLEVGKAPGVYDMYYAAGPLDETVDYVNFNLTNLSPGTIYYCRLKLTLGTQTVYSDEVIFETQLLTGVRENVSGFMVYPNSTNGAVTIDCQGCSGLITYELSGANGEVYFRGSVQHMSTIDLSFMASGIYVLKLTHGAQQFVKRIIKE